MVDIMQLNNEANEALRKDKNTINASIGMFYNENKELLALKSIKDGLEKLNPNNYLAYNTVTGGDEFATNIINWVFGNTLSKILKTNYLQVVATPGGSGAISSLFNLFPSPGDSVVVSDIRWQYERFVSAAKLNILEHKLFDNDAFNIADLKDKLNYLTVKQERIIVILNDPCHNPTGYSMTNDELSLVVNLLNSYPNNQFVLLYDLAYLDFDTNSNVREKLSILSTLNSKNFSLLSFSGSKTMGLYGLRIGAAILMGKNESLINDYYEQFKNHAVGNWSSTSTLGIDLINYVLSNNMNMKFSSELQTIKEIMHKRALIFTKEAYENNLITYPYKSGFYILIKSQNPFADFEKLKKSNLFLVPLKEGLRVALCSITINEVSGFAKKIKDALERP